MLGGRDEQGQIPATWYWLLALGVVLLALAGYVGYRVYPRLGLPEVEGAALLALAVAAGAASFFSPCSFPLLATLLSRGAGVDAPARGTATALRYALSLSLGVAVFLVLVGIAVELGGAAILGKVTFGSPAARTIRIAVGLLLIVLALVQMRVIRTDAFHLAERISLPLQRRQAVLRRRQPDLGYALFGFGYVLAGFG